MSSATNSDSDKQQLIVELKEKCAVVEEAIAYLVTSRNLIEGNATKIKNQILSDVTNALDALRRKEIQLLRQLDVVESHHLNILQTQYAELHQLLGNLQHTLHCAELQLEIPASYISGSDMGVVQTVRQQKIVPEPFSYHGDVSQLNVVIQNFGAVSTDLLTYQTHKDLLSKCLPSKLEEYDDGDNQLLYKTLEEIKTDYYSREKLTSHSLKLLYNKEDWLNELKMPASVECCNYPFSLPEHLISSDSRFWLKSEYFESEVSSVASVSEERKVEEWLLQINQKELHNESVISCLQFSCGEPAKSIGSVELLSAPETESSSNYSFAAKGPNPFTLVDSMLEGWCVMSNCVVDENVLEVMQYSPPEKCLAKSGSMDIENLDTLLCSGDVQMKEDDLQKWLVSGGCVKTRECTSANSPFTISCICHANEPCTNFSKAKCTQKAIEMQMKQLNISMEVDKNNPFYEFFQQMSNDKRHWLQMSLGGVREAQHENWLKNDPFSEMEKKDLNRSITKEDSCMNSRINDAPILWCKTYQDSGEAEIKYSHLSDIKNWLDFPECEAFSTSDRENYIRDDFKIYFQPGNVNTWLLTCET